MDTSNLSVLLGDSGADDTAISAMQLTADTLGAAINAGLGDVKLEDIPSEVTLVTLLIDNSGSMSLEHEIDDKGKMRYVSNADLAREGHNLLLDSLGGTKIAGGMQICCRYLNDTSSTDHGVLYPYRPLSGAIRLNASNYYPGGGTPLYDQVAVTLTGVATKIILELEPAGITVRAITVIVTDGHDEYSSVHRTPQSVRPIVADLLATGQHIIAGMGIDDEGRTDFKKIFTEMGLSKEWVLTPANTAHDIRQALALVSQSVVQASQNAGSFSQVALGGFGASTTV